MNILKEFFLPTEHNGHVPIGLSPRAMAAYLCFIILIVAAPRYAVWSQLATLAKPALYTSGDVIQLVNDSRRAARLVPLAENSKLALAAEEKVADMFRQQYFAHTSPDGRRPWSFFAAQGYRYLAAGENLAVDFLTAAEAEQAFLASPTHRANILNPAYTEIGVGVGQGEYRGRPSIMIAQYFGRPAAMTTETKPVPGKTSAKTIAPKKALEPAVAQTVPMNVLGVADVTPTASSIFANVSVDTWTRLALFALLALILLPFLLAFVRQGHLPFPVVLRTFVLLAVCAIVLAIGIPNVPDPQLASPAELSELNWLGS